MSYLPRMSKTYKEPEEQTYEDLSPETTFKSIPIASPLTDEKAFNPQSVLKQYSLYPHPPPRLPGPSLLEEAEHNERKSEEAKIRRMKEGKRISNEVSSKWLGEFPYDTGRVEKTINVVLTDSQNLKISKDSNDSNLYEESSSKPNVSDNYPAKEKDLITKKNLDTAISLVGAVSITDESVALTDSQVENSLAGVPFSSELDNLPHTVSFLGEKSFKKSVRSDIMPLEINNEKTQYNNKVQTAETGVIQCPPLYSQEKVVIMPSSIDKILGALSFLIQELGKNECLESPQREVKKLTALIAKTLSQLSKYKVDVSFSLQTSISDSKRLEKIYNYLHEYIKGDSGKNGNLGHRAEEKKVYCEVVQKEYELVILNEKLRESEIQYPQFKKMDYTSKAPEIVLQNKDLENEQLLAEIEFNSQELKRFQQTLAEKEWEIKKLKFEMDELKEKLTALKSKNKNEFSLNPLLDVDSVKKKAFRKKIQGNKTNVL